MDLLTFTKKILNAKLHWFVECMKWLHFYRFHWPENSGKFVTSALCQTESLKWILICESSDKKYFYNYPLKVNSRNTGIRCEKCSKLTIKTRSSSSVFYANFEHISHRAGKCRLDGAGKFMKNSISCCKHCCCGNAVSYLDKSKRKW